MEGDKPILEQMTDMMADAAHATKTAAKSAVRKVKKVAKKMMPKKSAKKIGGEEKNRQEKEGEEVKALTITSPERSPIPLFRDTL